MSRGLSKLQAAILRYAFCNYQHIEAQDTNYCDEIADWGVAWRPFDRGGKPNGSERAAMSRALRRLEARGLVQRRNASTGDRYMEHDDGDRPAVTRTTCVKLTAEGRRVAERLTKNKAPFVNRFLVVTES